MAVITIQLDESTPAQRRAFVTNFLNLDLSAEATDEQVNAAIAQAQPGVKHIFALEEAPASAVAPDEEAPIPPEQLAPEERGQRMHGSLGKSDPRWRIIIPAMETEDGSGGRDVLVGVNGRAWQMKRGVELDVPHRVIVALDNAVQDILRHEDDGQGNVNEVRRRSKRFTYEVIDRPSKDAIAAWEKATSAEFCA